MISVSDTKDSESARLVIKLVDKAADYKEVNVDIQGVSVHTNGDAEETDAGWVDLAGSDVGVKNLLEFTGGTELTLVDTDFPTGMISQIRLKLGPKIRWPLMMSILLKHQADCSPD